MELSGLDRLVAYARELGLDRGIDRAHPSTPSRDATRAPAGRSGEENGLRLSLSEQATSIAAGEAAPVERPASDTPILGNDARTASARHREAFAAYQRSAASIREERIRIIA